MLIRFTGPRHHLRYWGPYEFSREAGFVHEVSAEDAALMLTTPRERFAVDEAEPLLQVMSAEQAGLLALEGVGSVGDLANLAGERVKEVAKALRVRRTTVEAWVASVSVLTGENEEED